jgi:dTDP-4-amino-4,6-dideoxy-D-glucose/dTDP-4-amino-2,4-dideoxy-beta-L-xylose transaminase
MIPLFKVSMSEDVVKPLGEVMTSGFIGQGPKVEEFESLLSRYFGNPHCATLNSATAGLTLAYRLLGLQAGDEVLTSALTCTATNWPILANGLKIKWVDVDQNTCNMDLNDLRRKISKDTKAICVVHWGGYPLDLDELKKIQQESKAKFGHFIPIVEDCAHSMGSEYKEKKLGNHGNIAVYSFQAIKHFTTGDGGVILLPNEELCERAKVLRWYGINRNTNKKDFRCEEDVAEWGYKYHMNDINATIGIHNFPLFLKRGKKFRENSMYYDGFLKDVEGITILNKENDRKSASWIHTIKVENRDGFMELMKEKGIMVSRVHERNDIHSCVSEYKSSLPNLDNLCEKMICIPNGWWVTQKDRAYIVRSIEEGW